MTKVQEELLRYLYVGFRLQGRSMMTPNGKVFCRFLNRTITECVHRGWIVLNVEKDRYELTTEGRARALVKQRVEDFLNDLTNQPTT